MESLSARNAVPVGEPLHAFALGLAALGLLAGLVAHQPGWVKGAISLIILLPPLRLASAIVSEARARRFGVAAMGALVLAFLVFSRRLS